MKSHVLFKDTDIYLINFPPELTQWACIQKVRMNNADFKTALLQRMSSSHTVNTNKLPKVLKSRTPVLPPSPSLRPPSKAGWGMPAAPVPCLPAKILPWGGEADCGEPEDGDRPHRPGEKHNTRGFHTLTGSTDPKPMFYRYLLLLRWDPAGPCRGRGGPSPFPDHLQSNLRYGKTSE